jgi:hypothetical protein
LRLVLPGNNHGAGWPWQFPQRNSQFGVRIDGYPAYCVGEYTDMSQSSHKPGRAEQFIGSSILLCVAVIAAGVYFKQFSFNPAVLTATTIAPATATNVSATAPDETPPFCRRSSQ